MGFIQTKPQLIIFDLDGTLVDSAGDIHHAANQAFEAFKLPVQAIEDIKKWIGSGAAVFVEKALAHVNKKECFDSFYPLFMHKYEQQTHCFSKLYDGVEPFLKLAHSHQIPLAIASNKPFALIAPVLQHFKIDGYFQRVLGGDSLIYKKPDPLPLHTLCEEFAVHPEECWMIGDSDKDALAAIAANMPFIGVSYGYQDNHKALMTSKVPNKIVDNLVELEEYLV